MGADVSGREKGADMDLHAAFTEPGRARLTELARFLTAVDQLPGITAARTALRRCAPPAPGSVLLDAGCGLGLVTVTHRNRFAIPPRRGPGPDQAFTAGSRWSVTLDSMRLRMCRTRSSS